MVEAILLVVALGAPGGSGAPALEEARAKLEAGDARAALPLVEGHLFEQPDDAEAQLLLGDCYFVLGKWRLAYGAYDRYSLHLDATEEGFARAERRKESALRIMGGPVQDRPRRADRLTLQEMWLGCTTLALPLRFCGL